MSILRICFLICSLFTFFVNIVVGYFGNQLHFQCYFLGSLLAGNLFRLLFSFQRRLLFCCWRKWGCNRSFIQCTVAVSLNIELMLFLIPIPIPGYLIWDWLFIIHIIWHEGSEVIPSVIQRILVVQ